MGGLSTGVEFAWQMASIEAIQSFSELIEPVHLLIGIFSIDKLFSPGIKEKLQIPDERFGEVRSEWDAICAMLLKAGAPSAPDLRHKLRERAGHGKCTDPNRHEINRSDASRAIFKRAADLSLAQGAPVTALKHLLAVLVEDDGNHTSQLLRELGVDTSALRAAIPPPSVESPVLPAAAPFTPFLTKYGKDLTQLAREGKIHPCIGRRDELLQMVRSLSRATKNNPLLMGEAGVGKTAIVEGLAWRIAQGKSLPGKSIIQLQIAELVSGAKYRGDFEERLMQVLSEGSKLPELILFIDEIHTLVGAGDSSGGMDAANIMKPALARGEVRCIGATTIDEFRKHIEKDPALERRFQPIMVNEPSTEEALEILQAGYVTRFTERHGVTIDPSAVQAAVKLSTRYMPDRRLPDKAIDLLDESCALVAVPALSVLPGEKPGAAGGVVTGDAVAQVLAKWTGIPVGSIGEDDRERLKRMPEELKARVIGQDRACEKVADVVQRARAGLKAATRPIGVFLFVGPTGVGKTELAKATAFFLFNTDKAMVRIDMSEFMEKHTVSRLIGAPPGYIGHDEEGQLTGALRRTPFCVVLLDEVEKAHPDVLNLFLQVFDDGRLTDSKGRTADASNALFIMTSNVGGALPNLPIGFRQEDLDASSAATREEVGKAFRPEFLNRLDDIVVFSSLSQENIGRICRLMLQDLAKRLRAQEMGFDATDAAVAWLAVKGYDPAFGARALRRIIEQAVENPVVEKILGNEIRLGQTIVVDMKNDALVIAVQEGEKP
jgi:ATP-dependent Clp protease ATP-binding subunit ClpC